jgi:hypothetical protein
MSGRAAMPELFKVPIIRDKQGHEQLTTTLNAVVRAAFPNAQLTDGWRQRMDGVEFSGISSGGSSWWPGFGGVQLKVASYYRNAPMRRVLLKEGYIDLEAVRAKHKELAEISKQHKEIEAERLAGDQRRVEKIQALSSELKLRKYFPLRSGTEDEYYIELSGLTADDARALILLLRERGVEDVQEAKSDA